jgi:hypothetical protein
LSLYATGPGESLYEDHGEEDFTDLIDRVAKAIVSRQLTVPAIIFLESIKPLSFLGNQLLIFANPVVSLVVQSKDYYRFVRMIEDRENIEKLTVAIENENARDAEERRAARATIDKGNKKKGFFGRLFGRRKAPASGKGEPIGRQGDHQDTGD